MNAARSLAPTDIRACAIDRASTEKTETLPRARRHCTASSTSARSGATRNHSPRSGAQISTLATASRANWRHRS